jgi:hypothetical protein
MIEFLLGAVIAALLIKNRILNEENQQFRKETNFVGNKINWD